MPDRQRWVTKSYTYTEPADPDDDAGADDGAFDKPYTSTVERAGSKSDFDAGYESGRKAGYLAGYGAARYPSTEVGHAWAAGFIDGEGSIGIAGPRKSRSGSYTLTLSVSQKFRSPLDQLAALYGGSIRATTKGQWDWRVTNLAAYNCLDKIIPYLVLKRSQAILGIQFQGTVASRGTKPRGYSEEEVRTKAAMYQLMRDLKRIDQEGGR
jgi:hypothetical protein